MVLFSITGIALTVTAVFLTTEFLYNGIKLTRGPSMAVFILPVLPVFIGGFLFAYLIPSFLRHLYLRRAFTRRAAYTRERLTAGSRYRLVSAPGYILV